MRSLPLWSSADRTSPHIPHQHCLPALFCFILSLYCSPPALTNIYDKLPFSLLIRAHSPFHSCNAATRLLPVLVCLPRLAGVLSYMWGTCGQCLKLRSQTVYCCFCCFLSFSYFTFPVFVPLSVTLCAALFILLPGLFDSVSSSAACSFCMQRILGPYVCIQI